jgi:hypothetical protein
MICGQKLWTMMAFPEELTVQYGPNCVSQRKSYGWMEIFKRGNMSVPVRALDTCRLKYVW